MVNIQGNQTERKIQLGWVLGGISKELVIFLRFIDESAGVHFIVTP